MIVTILNFIKQYMQYLMIGCIAAGLANVYFEGGFTIPKDILVLTVVIFVIYPVMVNTRFEEIFAHFKEPRPLFCSLVINFILSPVAAFVLGRLFLSDQPALFSALLLIALLPTSSMSVAWTSFSGARVATALYLIPLNILFAAFVGLPLIFPFLMGDMIMVNQVTIIKNIGIVFFVPLLLGDISRRLIIRLKGEPYFKEAVKPNLGGVSALGILVLIFMVMSLKRNSVLIENVSLILLIIAPVVLYYGGIYLVSYGWARFLVYRNMPGNKAVVIVFTSVARHINIAIAIALSTFSLDVSALMLMVFIIAYIIQVPSLAFFFQKFGKTMAVTGTPDG